MFKNKCPVCNSEVSVPFYTEDSELVHCSDCHTRLVVTAITNNVPIFQEAPKMEEDWYE